MCNLNFHSRCIMSSQEEKLHEAVRSNDRQTLEELLSRGVSPDCVYYGTTPLLVAIEKGAPLFIAWWTSGL